MAIGAPEILIIAGIIVFLFGAKKLPELARGLGKAQGEFVKAKRDTESQAAREDAALGPASTAPRTEASDDARTLEAARALGIDVEGKTVDEVRTEMRARIG